MPKKTGKLNLSVFLFSAQMYLRNYYDELPGFIFYDEEKLKAVVHMPERIISSEEIGSPVYPVLLDPMSKLTLLFWNPQVKGSKM